MDTLEWLVGLALVALIGVLVYSATLREPSEDRDARPSLVDGQASSPRADDESELDSNVVAVRRVSAQQSHVEAIELKEHLEELFESDPGNEILKADLSRLTEIIVELESIDGVGERGDSRKVSGSIHDSVRSHLLSRFGSVRSLRKDSDRMMIHVVPPAKDSESMLLATSGASLQPEDGVRFEFVIYAPADWDLHENSPPESRWLLDWLIDISKLRNGIFPEDTIGGEVPGESLGPGTSLSGFLVLSEAEDFGTIRASGDVPEIQLLVLVPLYAEEIALVRHLGAVELLERFQRAGVSPVLDPVRVNVAE